MAPRKSAEAISASRASKIKFYPASTQVAMLFKVNFSFHFAYLPASSLTVVLNYPLPYLNQMNGSYFPKVSASFKKVASIIVMSSLHFLFKGLSSSFLFTFGGSGFYQINFVEQIIVPAFLPFLSKKSSVNFCSVSLPIRSEINLGLISPSQSLPVGS